MRAASPPCAAYRDHERRFGATMDVLDRTAARELLVQACYGVADISPLLFSDNGGKITCTNRVIVLEYHMTNHEAV